METRIFGSDDTDPVEETPSLKENFQTARLHTLNKCKIYGGIR